MVRRALPIVKIQRYSKRLVTFSKRRSGLMKKGGELCTLTGTELVIVVFSPGGKAYSFGHPSATSVIDRFLNEANEQQSAVEEGLIRAQQALNERELTFTLRQTKGLVENEKRSVELIDQERNRTEGRVWWEQPVEELNEEQLALLIEKMRKVIDEADQEEALMLEQASGSNNHGLPNSMGADSIGGQISDPRGKGPATSFPSYGFASSLPTEGASSSLYKGFVNEPPLYPQMQGYSTPFNPMVVGSSSGAQQDPRTFGFYPGQAYHTTMAGSSVDMTLDQMVMGDSSSGSQVPFNPVGAGSTPLNPGTFGFYDRGQTYDLILGGLSVPTTFDQTMVGSSSDVNGALFSPNLAPMTFDQTVFGSASNGNDYFNPDLSAMTLDQLNSNTPGTKDQMVMGDSSSGSQVPYNSVGAGSSSGTSQNPGTFGFYDQGQTYDHYLGGPSVPMTFDQTMVGSSSDVNGALFSPNLAPMTFDQNVMGSASNGNENFNPDLSTMTIDQFNPNTLGSSFGGDWSFP